MKKVLSLLLLLSACCSREYMYEIPPPCLASINIIDRNGVTETITNPDRLELYQNVNFLGTQPYQKVMRVFERDGCGDLKSYITSYYPNGQVKQFLEVVNGRACGAYIEWHACGTKKLEGKVIGGMADVVTGAEVTWLFDQASKVWSEDGNLIAVFNYCRGELEGESIHYHSNGKIWKEACYSKNQIEGPYRVFGECGQLLQESFYTCGKKNGKSVSYYNDGEIAASEEFLNGLLVSGEYKDKQGLLIAKVERGQGKRAAFENGHLSEMQTFSNGKPEGKVELYDKEGYVFRLFHVRDGIKNGEEIVFYERGLNDGPLLPKMSVTWYQGKVQGISKTWYSTGIQESQRELSNNAKNGLSTAWYRDGSLMLIEDYEQDKLIKGEYFQRGDRLPTSQVNDGSGVATLYDPDGTFIRKVTYVKSRPQQ